MFLPTDLKVVLDVLEGKSEVKKSSVFPKQMCNWGILDGYVRPVLPFLLSCQHKGFRSVVVFKR